MADRQVQGMKGELDVTTVEEFTDQMPVGLQPQRIRRGLDRIFLYTFSDGSKLEATFRPRGEEGSLQGLVLYMIDTQD